MELLDKLEESINTLTSEVQSLREENNMLKSHSKDEGTDNASILSSSYAHDDELIKKLDMDKELKEKALTKVNTLLDTIQVRLAQK